MSPGCREAGIVSHISHERIRALPPWRPADLRRNSLPIWAPCEIVAGVFGWHNAGNAPLTSPLAIIGACWYAHREFLLSAGVTSVGFGEGSGQGQGRPPHR